MRQGFTPIELPVAIATPAILATLLFLVFAKARLEQLPLAFLLHTQHYYEKFTGRGVQASPAQLFLLVDSRPYLCGRGGVNVACSDDRVAEELPYLVA